MNIHIQNVTEAVSSSEQLTANSIQLEQANEAIEQILAEVNNYWEETQQDAQKFSKELKADTSKLTKIVECNKEFATNVTNYANAQERASQNTVGGAVAGIASTVAGVGSAAASGISKMF